MSTNKHPRLDNHVIVLCGAAGDLAKRKLLPGLFGLHVAACCRASTGSSDRRRRRPR